MGFLDKLKGALGGGKAPPADSTKGPSQVLRENGIDPGRLKFAFAADGTVTIAGTLAHAGDRDRIVEIVRGMHGVNAVVDHMSAPAPAPEVNLGPGPAHQPAPAGEADQSGGQTTYTVQPGDSLWKIAEAHYGSGARYMKIFEANRSILDDPNKIFPGQELFIPDAGD